MSKSIQIIVNDDIYEVIRLRAYEARQSMNAYTRRLVEENVPLEMPFTEGREPIIFTKVIEQRENYPIHGPKVPYPLGNPHRVTAEKVPTRGRVIKPSPVKKVKA